MTPDEFRSNGYQMVDLIADYLETVEDRRIVPDIEPGDVRAMLPEHPPAAAEPWADVMADIERVVLPGITYWQHPKLVRLLAGQHDLFVDPRRTAVGRAGRPGHELDHVTGLHRDRDADARLDAGAAGATRPLPLDQ